MPRSARAPFAAALGCAAAFAVLAACVFGSDSIQRVDSDALNAVMAPSSDAAGSAVNAIARLANPAAVAVLLTIACAIALWRRRRRDAIAAVAVVAGANVSTAVLKHLFEVHRIQPEFINHEVLPTGIFPSGHATAAASIAIAFAFVVPRAHLGIAALLGVLYVAAVDTCVLILAWHYPGDVIAGTLVAATWGFAVFGCARALGWEGSGRSPAADEPGQPSSRAAISVK